MATQNDLAEHLGISSRMVRYHLQAGHLPPGIGRGGYDLDAARIAYIRHLRAIVTSQTNPDPDGLDPVAERARKDAAQADMIEHSLAVARQEYVHVSHLERVLARLATAARVSFQGIADRLRRKCPELNQRHLASLQAEIADATDYVSGLKAEFD